MVAGKKISIVGTKDNNKIKIYCDDEINDCLNDRFRILVNANYKFIPKVRNKQWDGKIPVYDMYEHTIYKGLLIEVLSWAKNNRIQVLNKVDIEYKCSSKEKLISWITNNLNIPFTLRYYQYQAIYDLMRYRRLLASSVPGSGKSAMMYVISELMQRSNKKTLIIVPTIDLVEQLYDNYKHDYNMKNIEELVQKINMNYKEKNFVKPIVISTWQSLQYKDPKDFEVFDCLLGDEADVSKDKKSVYRRIVLGCSNALYIMGLTGTLPPNIYVGWYDLVGLFGRTIKYIDEVEMREKQWSSVVTVKPIKLNYTKKQKIDFHKYCQADLLKGDSIHVRKLDWFEKKLEIWDKENRSKDTILNPYRVFIKDRSSLLGNYYVVNEITTQNLTLIKTPGNYVKIRKEFCVIEKSLDRERRYLSCLTERTKCICNFLNKLQNGNMLIMFTLIGLKTESGNYKRDFELFLGYKYKIHYIDGSTKKAERKRILDYVRNNPTGNIILSAKAIMSRGVNVPSLKYLVNVSGISSEELISQSLGRVARRSDEKGNKSFVIEFLDVIIVKVTNSEGKEKILQPKGVNQYRTRIKTYKKLGFPVLDHAELNVEDNDKKKIFNI